MKLVYIFIAWLVPNPGHSVMQGVDNYTWPATDWPTPSSLITPWPTPPLMTLAPTPTYFPLIGTPKPSSPLPDMYLSPIWTPETVDKIEEMKENQTKLVKKEIDGYFNDIAKLESLCKNFTMDFDINVCEMERGFGNDNRNGFFFEGNARDVAAPKDRTHEWMYLLFKDLRDSKKTQDRGLSGTTRKCKFKPLVKPSLADVFFKKEIRLLVTDDKTFTRADYDKTWEAIQNFNFCTEGLARFKLDTVTVNVNVSGKNWMEAAYDVMMAAKKEGIELLTDEKIAIDKETKHVNFNMDKHMVMIILPDDVDFGGAYGFAILHNGLSIIKATEAKKSSSILHEIGHNLGMRHSSSPMGGEYGDDRCLMGSALNNKVCFNGHKSFYLGLYRKYTTIVYPLLEPCNTVLSVVDWHDHLHNRRDFEKEIGKYSVIVQVSSGKGGAAVYIMYYSDKDIIVGTKGSIGTIEDSAGDSLTFADSSQRVFDLAQTQTITFDRILYKRCDSKKGAKLLISSDLDATNACY